MKSLADIKTADNGIDLVYLFSNFGKLVLTSDKNGYPYQDFFDKEALDCYIDGTYSPMMDRVYTPADGDPIEFITVYQNIPKKSSGSLGCLILNIEKSFLFSFPDEAAILQMSVYDSDGRCLFSQSPDISYQKEQEFQNQLYRSNGSFIYDTGNEELVILNTFSSVTGWTYIAAAPMPVFFNSYRAISQLLFKIAAVTLIILCLLSFLISYRLYLPLRNLVNTISGKDTISGKSLSGEYQLIHSAYKDILNKNTSMSAALENMKPAVKDDFFFSLLRVRRGIGQGSQFMLIHIIHSIIGKNTGGGSHHAITFLALVHHGNCLLYTSEQDEGFSCSSLIFCASVRSLSCIW